MSALSRFALVCAATYLGACADAGDATGPYSVTPVSNTDEAEPEVPSHEAFNQYAGDDPPPCELRNYPTHFAVTAVRGYVPTSDFPSNTMGSISASLQAGVRHVELDFHVTADDHLVSAHEDTLVDCGRIATMDLETALQCNVGGSRVVTLDEVLAMDFDTVYVDLKDTASGDAQLLEAAAFSAIDSISAYRDPADVGLMVYDTTPAAIEEVERADIRVALKGYPRNDAEVVEFIDRAVVQDFEFICVEAAKLDPGHIRDAAAEGVWFLGWDMRLESFSHLEALAEAGMGGLISPESPLVSERVAPDYRPLCNPD